MNNSQSKYYIKKKGKKSGRSGWYPKGLCSLSEAPQLFGEMGKEEPSEIQQKQVQGSSPEK